MRTARGRGNDARKVLTYYSVNFDLHPPFQVLCDGPTISLSIRNNLYLKQSLPKLLGATAYPVVTNCIVAELKSLGEDFSGAALFAKRLTRIPCAHENKDGPAGSASACIVARVKRREEFPLLLATNDGELMRSLVPVVGVPLITVENQTKLVLRPPSMETLDYVRRQEGNKGTLVSASDRALLDKVRAEEMARRPVKTQRSEVRKRKRAKGPNPLSVRKTKRAKTNRDEQSHRKLNGDDAVAEGKGQGALNSESAREVNPVKATGVEQKEQVAEIAPTVHTPDMPTGKDHAELADPSKIENNMSLSTSTVAPTAEKAKRKRQRNRKRSRQSDTAKPIDLLEPDHGNREAHTKGSGDDAIPSADKDREAKEISRITAPSGDSANHGTAHPITNETQMVRKEAGGDNGKTMEASVASKNDTRTKHEERSRNKDGEVPERNAALSAAENDEETSKSGSVAIRGATSVENKETKDSGGLSGIADVIAGENGNPEHGEAESGENVVPKKKKHRNNRRRRPKKTKDIPANQAPA